ncbi:MAG TPA: protein kinase, partial [Blastocatellia bacterium]|nr:protein kinase [Blastocatellia bacterium]
MPITEGTRLDRYQILSPIGTGGMGEVYLAQDTRLGRKVAIKMLPAQYTQDTERLRRFEQEAFAASALNHPNIITIYEIGEATINADKVHFIVTEYIEGQTLRRRLAGGPLPIHEVLEISLQIAGALATAHGAGIIHRDLKPENLMIRPDGYVKMLDFGLAKLTEKAVVGDLADVVFDSSELQATTVMAAKTGDTASLGQDSVQDAARENDLFVTA